MVIASAMLETELHHISDKINLTTMFVLATGAPTKKEVQLMRANEQYGEGLGTGLFFGDTLNDYRAATASGLDFVGIGDTALFNEKGLPSELDFLDLTRRFTSVCGYGE